MGEAFNRKSFKPYLIARMLWLHASTGTVADWEVFALVVSASYVLGCCVAGYYLVRWRRGHDIRNKGSGSTGATNVGRELGHTGFAVTFVLDCAKGALVSWMVMYLKLGPWESILCALAVVAGHIWPAQLRFRGGKGVATLLGVLVVADYRILLAMAGLFVVAIICLHRFTLSGLTAIAATPPVLAVAYPPPQRALGLLLLVLPVLYAHRQNIREDIGSLQARLRSRSSADSPTRREQI